MINRKLKMDKIEWENLFSICVPQQWTVHEENGLISLSNNEVGVGVLQFSFAKRKLQQKPSSEEAKKHSIAYAKQCGWKHPADSLKTFYAGSSPIAVFSDEEFCDGGLTLWRVWHLMGEKRMALITYNCLASDMTIEEKLCDSIIKSFQWK